MYVVKGSRLLMTRLVVKELYCVVTSVSECVTLMMYPVTAPFSSPGSGAVHAIVIEYGEVDDPLSPVGDPLGPEQHYSLILYFYCIKLT